MTELHQAMQRKWGVFRPVAAALAACACRSKKMLRGSGVRVRSGAGCLLIVAVLFFIGTVFWAKEQNPFSRKWFTLETENHHSFKCVVVLPKPVRQYPMVVYAHGWNGSLMNDGNDLRRMAELGLAVVSLEYNQTNDSAFAPEMEALLRHVGKQKWANTNAMAWAGYSMGANRMLDFVARHPERQPELFIHISGGGISAEQTNNRLESVHCPVLMIHGGRDEVFPEADVKRLELALRANGTPVELKTLSGTGHGLDPERGVVFRCIGEYCRMHLAGEKPAQGDHSIALREAKMLPLWLFCFPAVAWGAGWLACWRIGRSSIRESKIKPGGGKMALRWLALVLAVLALAETAMHLVLPQLAVSNKTLSIARRFLIQPNERADFEFLAGEPVWPGEQLKTLLDHVKLSRYNRDLVNWQLDDKIYRDYVLSPVIEPSTAGTGQSADMNWRRLLWEEFYPRIRHESSPENAAQIVVRHLRERMTIVPQASPSHNVPDIWLKQTADEKGFEVAYAAALRSVGVPAQLDKAGQVELFAVGQWKPAPQPVISVFLPRQ